MRVPRQTTARVRPTGQTSRARIQPRVVGGAAGPVALALPRLPAPAPTGAAEGVLAAARFADRHAPLSLAWRAIRSPPLRRRPGRPGRPRTWGSEAGPGERQCQGSGQCPRCLPPRGAGRADPGIESGAVHRAALSVVGVDWSGSVVAPVTYPAIGATRLKTPKVAKSSMPPWAQAAPGNPPQKAQETRATPATEAGLPWSGPGGGVVVRLVARVAALLSAKLVLDRAAVLGRGPAADARQRRPAWRHSPGTSGRAWPLAVAQPGRIDQRATRGGRGWRAGDDSRPSRG